MTFGEELAGGGSGLIHHGQIAAGLGQLTVGLGWITWELVERGLDQPEPHPLSLEKSEFEFFKVVGLFGSRTTACCGPS